MPIDEAEAVLGVQAARTTRSSISRISLFLRSAGGEQRAQALAQGDEGLARAEVQERRAHRRLHLRDLVAQAVGRQVDEHVLEHARVHRAHRLQQRRALLELGRLGLDALQHQADLGAVLAAQAAQLERLLGELAARVADVAADVVLDPQRPFLDDLLEHLAALRQELRAERRLEQRQPALVQPHRVAADARGERLPRREREDALQRHAERARGLLLLLRDLRLDDLERRQRILEGVDLVEDDEARRRVGAEVVAPDREVGLGDAGVGAEDEDGRVRARQQAQRQLGLGADRVQARRVEHDQALLQQRVRVVDEGVAPGRHLDLAFVVARRVVVGRGVVPEAERARLRFA